MKIIDFHTHYYPDKIVEKALSKAIEFITPVTNGTRKGLIDLMNECNISRSVSLPLATKLESTKGLNTWAKYEDHDEIIMIGSIHPNEENPIASIKMVADLKLGGIKLHPEYQQFTFDDEKYNPIWEACIENNIFVITHSGFDVMFPPPYHCNPTMLKNVKTRYPELTLIGAHLGGMKMINSIKEELLGLPIYLDLAFMTDEHVSDEDLYEIIKAHGAKYILYGSDSPWTNPMEIINKIERLPLSLEEKNLIFHQNAEKIIKDFKNISI